MRIKDKTSKGIQGIQKEAGVLKGEQSKNKIYATSRKFDDANAAKKEFPLSKERLFNVNAWSNIPGIANASFQLYSPEGQPLNKSCVHEGDFVRIDLPGPLPYYWVKVVETSENDESAQLTVQPAYDPTDDDDKTVTDHFFQDQARSIFRVELAGIEITGMEIGLNEAINNQEAEAGRKKLINTLVSEGAWAGLQKYQWQNLTDYLVGVGAPSR
jgi:hypothetical protein